MKIMSPYDTVPKMVTGVASMLIAALVGIISTIFAVFVGSEAAQFVSVFSVACFLATMFYVICLFRGIYFVTRD